MPYDITELLKRYYPGAGYGLGMSNDTTDNQDIISSSITSPTATQPTIAPQDSKLNNTMNLMGLLGSPEALMGLSLLGAGSRGENFGQAALPSFIEGLKGASLVNEFGKIKKQQEFVKNLPEGVYKTVGSLYPEVAAKGMIDEELQKPKIKAELQKETNAYGQKLMTTYADHPVVKDFNVGQNQLNKLISGVSQNSAAGDLSAVFTYMKVLDPTSVVREGEQATAQNARGVPDAIKNTYNNIMTGERLTTKQKEDFTSTAIKLFSSNQQSVDALKNNISNTIIPKGINPNDVFIDSDIRPKQIKVGENIINVPINTRLVGYDMNTDQYVYQTPGKNSFQFKVKRQVE
jgi:hypothetical protein